MTKRRRNALVIASVVVVTAVTVAWAATPQLTAMPNPVVVNCFGGSGQAPFVITSSGMGSMTTHVTSIVPTGSCPTYSINPQDTFIPGGGSTGFTASVGPGAADANCFFTIYVDGNPSVWGFQVNGTDCGAGPGQLVLTPNTMPFGNVQTGTSKTLAFTSLQNQTDEPISSLHFAVTGTGFELGAPCAGETQCDITVLPALAIGEFYTPPPEVVCRPMTQTPLTGMFTVTGDSTHMAMAPLSCMGTAPGTGPEIDVPPTTLVRAATVGLQDTGPGPLHITNQGDAALTIAISFNGGAATQWSVDQCGAASSCTILPASFRDVNVTYTASALFDQSTTLVIDTNDPDDGEDPVLITAQGTGLGAVLTVVTPASGMIGFGQIPIGQMSSPSTVTVRNDGNILLNVGAMINPANPTFAVTPGSRMVPPGFGNERTFDVTCTASAPPDIPVTGNLVLTGGGGASISLSCTPVASLVTIDPAAIDFGAVRLGDTVTSQLITIENLGAVPVVLGTPVFNPAGQGFTAVGFPSAGTVLNTNDNATFTIEYTPPAQGTHASAMTMLINGEPTRSIDLDGVGAVAAGAITPTELDLHACAGQLASETVTLTSIGDGNPATPDAPFIADMPRIDNMEFMVMSAVGTNLPATMTEGSRADVDVFIVAPDGMDTGTLSWPTDLDVALAAVPVKVTGAATGLSVSPGRIDFGSVAVGEPSAPHAVELQTCGGEMFDVTATITEDAGAAFTVDGPTTPAPVGANPVMPWQVRFTPPSNRTYTGKLHLAPSGGSPIDIDLSGIGGDGTGGGGETNYYACGCRAPLDAGGAAPLVIALALVLVPRRRKRATCRRSGSS